MTLTGLFAPARLAAVVGLVFSALAIVAGTRVLTGLDVPDYPVLRWLVQYNVAAGASAPASLSACGGSDHGPAWPPGRSPPSMVASS